MPARRVRLGTRSSALALWQARWVATRLNEAMPDTEIELVSIRSRGDAHPGALSALGGVGHFTSDLERALAEGEVDVVVHSLKDLPIAPTSGLEVVAVPLRDDPRDALVSREGIALSDLPLGARIGTSSPRRACLLLAMRRDLQIIELRGNVDSRVRRVDEGLYDAVVVAAAGLIRLGLEDRIAERFAPATFPPAPGQGALAVQVRAEAGVLYQSAAGMDDPVARETTIAERSVLKGLGGGCSAAIGTYARREEGRSLSLRAVVGSRDGRRVLRVDERGEEPAELGGLVAEQLIEAGARELLG